MATKQRHIDVTEAETEKQINKSVTGRFAPRTFRSCTFRHLDVSPPTVDVSAFLCVCYGRPLSVSGRPCYILPMFFLFFFMAALFSGPG